MKRLCPIDQPFTAFNLTKPCQSHLGKTVCITITVIKKKENTYAAS